MADGLVAELEQPLAPTRAVAAAVASPVVRAAAAFGLGLATRLPFRGRFLFNWDALQFALGMARFDLAAHRPHPPGYIGYVVLGRVLSPLAGGDVQLAMATLSAVAAGLTVAAAYLVARSLLDEAAGIAAAVVVLTSPLFWFYGGTALTYGLEPLLSLAGFWLAWRARHGGRADVVVAAAAIGLMGAIRPSCELFLLPLVVAAVASRRPGWRTRREDLAIAALALAGGTAAWALPLVAWSGGLAAYLRAGLALGARVSGDSALWTAGLAGLAKNTAAVLEGVLLGAGLLPAIVLAALAGSVAAGTGLAAAPSSRGRQLILFAGVWAAPAVLTFALVHIGQLAYMLFALPAIALLAGPALRRFARVVSPRRQDEVRAWSLAAIALVNLALFLTPVTNLAAELGQRDAHVAALLAAVERYPASTTLLLTDPEGPGSYRLAEYYLPAYPAVAVGRDARGRAGEMFADHGGAPEYDLARFAHTGPLLLPSLPLAVVLDEAVRGVIADRERLVPVALGDGLRGRVYVVALDPADPPVAHAHFIFVRRSDCAACGPPARIPAALVVARGPR